MTDSNTGSPLGAGCCPACGRPLAAPLSELIPTREIAKRLKIPDRTVRRLIRAGAIPAILPEGNQTLRVPRVAFERWFAREDWFPERPPRVDPDPVVVRFLHSRLAEADSWGVAADG